FARRSVEAASLRYQFARHLQISLSEREQYRVARGKMVVDRRSQFRGSVPL
ncbi:MAG: hypothetical protein ACI8T1_001051, partial [Verrucomicrobiales bacterium]